MTFEAQAVRLYESCFPGDIAAREIVSFGLKHGAIYTADLAGKIVSMCIVCPLGEYDYLFAAATDPGYRGRGFFTDCYRKAAEKHDSLVCIPQSSELFGLYKKLGMSEESFVFDTVLRPAMLEETTDIGRLYDIYQSSAIEPEKTEELFASTIKCHFLWGGKAYAGDEIYYLTENSAISEVCVRREAESYMHRLLMGGENEICAVVSLKYAQILGVKGQQRRIAASQNKTKNNIYLNILYN